MTSPMTPPSTKTARTTQSARTTEPERLPSLRDLTGRQAEGIDCARCGGPLYASWRVWGVVEHRWGPKVSTYTLFVHTPKCPPRTIPRRSPVR